MQSEKEHRVIKVAIVETQGLFRELLVNGLSREKGLEVCGAFSDPESALSGIPALNPSVVVARMELDGGMNGVELGLRLRDQMPHLGIVILSHFCDASFLELVPADTIAGWSYLRQKSIVSLDSLRRAIEGTADGFVVLDPQLTSVGQAGEDGPLGRLSPRHREILALIAQGLSNSAIAKRLFLAEKSVENQVNLLYSELGISRRDKAIQPRVRAALIYLEKYRGVKLGLDSRRDARPTA